MRVTRERVGLRQLLVLVVFVLQGHRVCANDLLDFYRLALTRDAVLQAATYQRDASIEVRPQALSQLLPQISATGSAARENIDYAAAYEGLHAPDCTLSADASMQRCYGTTHGLGLNLTQTIWSYQAFSLLKEANFQAAAAEATWRGAQENLLLRVALAYFAILSANDQLVTNRNAREAFSTLLNQAKTREKIGVGARSDVEQAQSFYDATEQGVIDAQNALDDANLALTEIIGPHAEAIAQLQETIPLVSPEPASADEWVTSARRDNFDVRAAQLKVEAAERDISAQRGKGLPTFSLTGSGSKAWQDEILGGNQSLNTVGVSFSWPLFQGGAVASAVRQSRALYRQAQALYDTAQRDTERQTRSAFRDVVSGIKRITAARRAVASGHDAVEGSRRNVEFGTGSVFDLLNAQNNYYAAQRAYSQTRYDYLTALLTLKQQAGSLAEHDLEVIDGLLVAHGS
jgi:outer membrane protein